MPQSKTQFMNPFYVSKALDLALNPQLNDA